MRLLHRLISILIAATVIAALAAPAEAYIYAGKRKKVNCGVVKLPGGDNSDCLKAALLPNGTMDATAPLGVGDVFRLLDYRADLKPPGWSLENPLAQVDPSTGRAYSKDQPEYWAVDLQSVRSLSRMHVLYLPAHGKVTLDEQDREKLRQFVDGGGVLWIDNAAGTSRTPLDFKDSFFIWNFHFDKATGGDVPFSRHHPLLTMPFWLNDTEIATLGSVWGQYTCTAGMDFSRSSGPPSEFDMLYPVVMNNGTSAKPSTVANAYGSGRIVATSNSVGRGCFLDYPYNLASVKFAFNVISWASTWTHLRKDARHSGSSIDTVGGTKLLKVWTLDARPSDKVESAPVIYKNVAFYSAGDTLYACDLMPQEDLDNDGNPDDGAPSLPSGMQDKGQDIIWMWDESMSGGGGGGGGVLSAPSVVSMQDPSSPGSSVDVVMVTSSSGSVYALMAFPIDPNGVLQEDTTTLFDPWPASEPIERPYPPLYVNGWILVACKDGRLRAYNPLITAWNVLNPGSTETDSWVVSSKIGADTSSAEPRSGPTFGFTKNDTSGAVVGMAYWFAGPWQSTAVTPTPGTEQNDHIYGIPVYVSNDRLRIERVSSTGVYTECRATYRDGMLSGLKVRVYSNGVLIPTTDPLPNCRLVGDVPDTANPRPGWIVIQSALPSDAIIYATYSLDYAPKGTIIPLISARKNPLEPRSNSANTVPATKISGIPAMGPDGMMFVSGTRDVTGSTGGGSVYGIRNDGSSQTTKWNYFLHGGTVTGEGITVPGVIVGSSGAPMLNPRALSSPAISAEKVFAAVTGDSGSGSGPTAALVCFKANSDFVIRVTENAGRGASGDPVRKPKSLLNRITGAGMDVKIWQPNLLVPTAGIQPTPLNSAIKVPADMIDYSRGTISFDSFDRLKLKGGTGGVMQTNTFSPSLPVWVFVDNIEVPVDFSTWAPSMKYASSARLTPPKAMSTDSVDLSGWNNMLWYYVVPDHDGAPCTGVHSSPVVIGNTVYFVCDDGYLYALPTESGESSAGPIDEKLVVWKGQVCDPPGAKNLSMAGSNGVLLIPGEDGLTAYTNATTLVADGNRLMEMDGAGEIKWSVDTIIWPAAKPTGPNTPPSTTAGPVNKPSRAKYLPNGDLLVVNTGANQVCKIDKSGTVGFAGALHAVKSGSTTTNVTAHYRWMYDKFTDPKTMLRPGQPTQLSGPTDAIFWQEYEKDPGGTTMMLVYHCLIADSGNHRVVDLIYRFNIDKNGNPVGLTSADSPGVQPDPSTGFYLPELNWVSFTDSTNERFNYECLQKLPNPDGTEFIWAAVSNYRTDIVPVDKSQTQGLGGAIVALGYRSRADRTSPWSYGGTQSGRIVAACDRIDAGGIKPLAGPRYFQVIDRPGGVYPQGRYLIICDNYGVYEAGPLGGGADPLVRRTLHDADYRLFMRDVEDLETGNAASEQIQLRIPLVATSVQELPNGNWLITNGYSGVKTNPTDPINPPTFGGEVFEVSWNPGFTPDRIEWCSPNLYCECTVIDPGTGSKQYVPIDDRWKQKVSNGQTLQQPKSAIRQY